MDLRHEIENTVAELKALSEKYDNLQDCAESEAEGMQYYGESYAFNYAARLIQKKLDTDEARQFKRKNEP